MNKLKIQAIATFLFATLAGCDTINGVTRVSSDIGPVPVDAYQCVADAITNMEDVELVRYTVDEGSRPLTLSGVEAPDVVHSYWYRYSGIGAGMQLVMKYDGRVEFRQSHIRINGTPSQADIDVIRPLMTRIEKAVADQCGITALETGVSEKCSNVRCE